MPDFEDFNFFDDSRCEYGYRADSRFILEHEPQPMRFPSVESMGDISRYLDQEI